MRLHPFRALVPPAALADEVVSVPYDVISTAEARQLAEGRPRSFLHVIRPEIDLPEGADSHDPRVYQVARDNLRRLVEEGSLVRDGAGALWVWRLEWRGRAQVGVVGLAEAADYDAGRIKRHEHTRKDKEVDRTRHVDTVGAHTGPVFLTCRGTGALAACLEAAAAGTAERGIDGPHEVRHDLWRVSDPATLATFREAFAGIDAFYIADGHHRAASAARTAERRRGSEGGDAAQRFLTVVFPHDQLRILDYNRVVHDLSGLEPPALLRALDADFEVGPPGASPSPEAPRSFGLYLEGAWRRLTARRHAVPEGDPVGRLDVAILQDRILGPHLGIGDPRTDPRISFVGGIRGTSELVRRVDEQGGGCAFALYPTSIDELLDVADAGEVMPPKSTWFEPKLLSGLLVNPIDGDLL